MQNKLTILRYFRGTKCINIKYVLLTTWDSGDGFGFEPVGIIK